MEMAIESCSNNHKKKLDSQKTLPEGVLFDILIRVPARDLISLKTTCKQWKNIINNHEFAKAHLKHWVYTVEMILSQPNDPISDYASYDIRTKAYHQLSLHTYLKKNVRVLDSLDGLVLFFVPKLGNKMYLCNPLTQRLKLLFRIPKFWAPEQAHFRLAFDYTSQKYKVIGFCRQRYTKLIDSNYCVLTVNDDEEGKWPTHRDVRNPIWRKVESRFLHSLLLDFALVAISGTVYWIAHTMEKRYEDRKAYIQSMDIASEELKEERIQLPCQPIYQYWGNCRLLKMEKMKGSLCVAIPDCHTELGIWTLKEDWDKLYNICCVSPIPDCFNSFVHTQFYILLVMDDQNSEKTKFMVRINGQLFDYCIKSQVLKPSPAWGSPNSTYVPSLISWH